MIFTSPSWTPQISAQVPDTLLVGEFVTNRKHEHYQWSDENPTLVEAFSGTSYNMREIRDRISALSRSLSNNLGWLPNKGSPWEKIAGICSLNTIDFLVVSWAIHQLGGICLLIHSTSSALEMDSHLHLANCKVVITCAPILPVVEHVAQKLPLQIFLLDLPKTLQPSLQGPGNYRTVQQLVEEGLDLGALEPEVMNSGEGRTRVAYLSPTSGTSGKQKLAQLTHVNVISNILQASLFENVTKRGRTETCLGILPLSHSYGLLLAHLTAWRGDCMVLHPKFDMQAVLSSISKYKIERLYLVPSIINALTNNSFLFDMYDVSSVKSVVTGSAAFGSTLAGTLRKIQPTWQVLPGYGLTETCVIVSFTSSHSIFLGSAGCLLPLVEARLLADDGSDVNSYDECGELLLRSPSIMPGYFADEIANETTFDSKGWLRTGDVATFRTGPDGVEHLFIVDRKKDIMKVKGLQVAPTEIEAQLLLHPAIDEAAVIAVPDEDAGERPYAFVVRSPKEMATVDEKTLKVDINKCLESVMSEPHWLKNNIRFVADIPKSHNGKALKYKLKALVA